MTYLGAIKQLHELRNAEDMPIYYKPVISEVINVLLMDTQEVKHGRWKPFDLTWGRSIYYCTSCGDGCEVPTEMGKHIYEFCPHCGAKMDEVINEKE